MARIVVYTKSWCGYCRRATGLLEREKIEFDVIDVTSDPGGEREMIQRSGRFTVPQVFIDGAPIGGSVELLALAASGRLAELLRNPPVGETPVGGNQGGDVGG